MMGMLQFCFCNGGPAIEFAGARSCVGTVNTLEAHVSGDCVPQTLLIMI
jgi:hypothetical protein